MQLLLWQQVLRAFALITILSLSIVDPPQKPRQPPPASSHSLGTSILIGTRYASSSNLAPIFVPVSRVKKVMKSTS